MTRLAPRSSTSTTPAAAVEPTTEQSRFPVGSFVKVAGHRGAVYRVVGYNRDGSLRLFGGPSGHGASRSIMPDRVRRTRGAS